MIEEHFPNLILAIPKPKGNSLCGIFGDDRHFRISFAELQRMHLRKLQCKLVKHVVDMRFNRVEPQNWEADLRQYGEFYPPCCLTRLSAVVTTDTQWKQCRITTTWDHAAGGPGTHST